jgi:hypothetical protein
MGDVLCRLIYFQYIGAIPKWNMDRHLWVWDGGEILSGIALKYNFEALLERFLYIDTWFQA